MKRIPIIVGPTSSGKTSLALKLCHKFSGQILSADSRQIFKKMNIGTGKVPVDGDIDAKNFATYWTLNDITVFGYDLVFPHEYFSADDYSSWAKKKIISTSKEGNKNIFVVGGTGFYIDLITERASTSKVLPNFGLREELMKLSNVELQQRLLKNAPEVLNTIDKNNPARLIRAIEIAENNSIPDKNHENIQLGQSNLSVESPTMFPEGEFEFFFVGLVGSRNFLYSRADTWVEKIWANGLLEEVRDLRQLDYGNSLPMKGLIYKTVNVFIDGNVNEEDAKQRMKFDIHAYIRRQQTWFKRNKDITWFDIEEPDFFQKVSNHVQSKIDG